MNSTDWVGVAGVAGQLLVSAFFFGATYQKISGLVRDGDRTDKRVDTIELRLNDHTERIAKLEGRET